MCKKGTIIIILNLYFFQHVFNFGCREQVKTTSTRPLNHISELKLCNKIIYKSIIENQLFNSYSSTAARKTPQFPCVSCGRAVRHNSKAISCDSCYNWIHLACCPDFSLAEYCELQQSDDDFHYFCKQCLLFELPFNSEPEAGDTDIYVNFLDKEPDEEVTSEEGPNTDFSYFDCFNKRGLHCIHLNARCLLP